MGYMKLLSFMSHDAQTTNDNLRSLKSGYARAKKNGMNYLIYQDHTWTLDQVEAMIKLLIEQQKKYDKIRRTEPSASPQSK